jgi:hypothetical protein
MFMRHRSPLHRVELSSIPKGSAILAAKLIICRAGDPPDAEHDPATHPTMWVAEPCNRPWVETEVSAYEYAKDKFWKEIGGQYYGEDPDFLGVSPTVREGEGHVWDFTEAVILTDGTHENHGFMMHGDGRIGWSRLLPETPRTSGSARLLVSYEPRTPSGQETVLHLPKPPGTPPPFYMAFHPGR